jgi:SAM-dependent methyltransferase
MFALPPEFFVVHQGLPREGPGSDEATREALRRLPPLPSSPRVLDLGCGPGAQTLVLARELGTRVVAVDLHRPFLDQLERSAREAGLAERVELRCEDIGALGDPPSSVDLIWCESAIFVLGFVEGLRRWKPLLRAGGLMVVTEAVWLVDDPPEEAIAHWREYPITRAEQNVRLAEAEGLRVIDTFLLGAEAWWEYYRPLRRRVQALRRGAVDPALAQVLDETEREIAGFERHGDAFGYQFFLMEKQR